MGELANIRLTYETLSIVSDCAYCVAGREVRFPNVDFRAAEVLRLGDIQLTGIEDASAHRGVRRVSVENIDVLEMAMRLENPLVLNFANAHFAGGGFYLGANAQEESICRRSTLYASLKSPEAKRFYRENNFHIRCSEADTLIYSPNVIVFRNQRNELLLDPRVVSVVSAAAPNRRGLGVFLTRRALERVFERRIRMILELARRKGHRNLVLGAWGCGAFGNSPALVAACFKRALADERQTANLDFVGFAIPYRLSDRNFRAFGDCFPQRRDNKEQGRK